MFASAGVTPATSERTMNHSKTKSTPEQGRHLQDETDIGSGEKTPAQHDTDEMIRQIPPLPETDGKNAGDTGMARPHGSRQAR
jgi:hypothetical protein